MKCNYLLNHSEERNYMLVIFDLDHLGISNGLVNLRMLMIHKNIIG